MQELWDHLGRVWPAVVVFLAIWWPVAVIVAKMGFPSRSGWVVGLGCSLLGVVSWELGAAYLLMLLFFLALREWPIWRELTYARVHGDIGSEEDAYALLEYAVKLERKGDWEKAIRLSEEVLARFQDTPPGNDAGIALQRLKRRQQAEGL